MTNLFERLADEHGWVLAEPSADGVRAAAAGDDSSISYDEESLGTLSDHANGSWWMSHRSRWAVRVLADHHVGSVLDIGAGSGGMAADLLAAGVDVIAIEPFREGARLVAALGVASVHGQLRDLSLPTSAVPAAGYFDVIEHIADPHPELSEALRVLEPGGLLLVTVPAFQWLWSDEDEFAGHHRRYTRSSLRRELEAVGFVAERVDYLFAALVPLALAGRRVPYLLGWHRSKERSLDTLSHQLEPSPVVDRLASWWLRLESAAADRVRLPFGLSVAGVFRKPGAG